MGISAHGGGRPRRAAFGSNGAQTAAFRPDTTPAPATLPSGLRPHDLVERAPMFVGFAYGECLSSGSSDDYLVGRIETNYLFADGFD
jgi:hypothetical protein